MKNTSIQLTGRFFVLVVSLIAIGFSPANAQIGNLGIYGSPVVTIRGNVQYARLDPDLPPNAECDGCEQILPLNGLKNFNFWYTPDGKAFLAGGSYKVSYWDANLTTRYGDYDYVSYSPNSTHTNGVQVRAFNNPPSTSLGLHGVILVYDENNNVVPLPNADVTAIPVFNQTFGGASVRSNGNGYFSFYYKQSGSPDLFLPVESSLGSECYYLIISGSLGKCGYFHIDQLTQYVWAPSNTTNPNSSTYFVDGAETVVDNIEPLACR